MISRVHAHYLQSIGGHVPLQKRAHASKWKRVGRFHFARSFGGGWLADVWIVPSTGKKRRWWTYMLTGPGDVTLVEPVALLRDHHVAKIRASIEIGKLMAIENGEDADAPRIRPAC